jgi:hypothetical protein
VLLIRCSQSGVPETIRIVMRSKRDTPQAATFPLRPYDVVLVQEFGVVHASRLVEQYVFRFIPPQVAIGFTYLLNRGVVF